jgi:hypothetical protein
MYVNLVKKQFISKKFAYHPRALKATGSTRPCIPIPEHRIWKEAWYAFPFLDAVIGSQAS